MDELCTVEQGLSVLGMGIMYFSSEELVLPRLEIDAPDGRFPVVGGRVPHCGLLGA